MHGADHGYASEAIFEAKEAPIGDTGDADVDDAERDDD